jgi:hypothetical protein
MATDYRDIYADILAGFLGNEEITSVIPDFTRTPLGLF